MVEQIDYDPYHCPLHILSIEEVMHCRILKNMNGNENEDVIKKTVVKTRYMPIAIRAASYLLSEKRFAFPDVHRFGTCLGYAIYRENGTTQKIRDKKHEIMSQSDNFTTIHGILSPERFIPFDSKNFIEYSRIYTLEYVSSEIQGISLDLNMRPGDIAIAMLSLGLTTSTTIRNKTILDELSKLSKHFLNYIEYLWTFYENI